MSSRSIRFEELWFTTSNTEIRSTWTRSFYKLAFPPHVGNAETIVVIKYFWISFERGYEFPSLDYEKRHLQSELYLKLLCSLYML